MANIKVAGNLYYELDGQLMEIKRQLRQPSGYPFDPSILKSHLQVAVEGRFSQASTSFRYDKRKDGWELLENTSRRLTTASINGISFLKENESSINGEEMVRRARMELDANYGQEDAEWLLEHQKEIPVELQNFYLPFPGTIWRGASGGRLVPYLDRDDVQWVLNFRWLGRVWNSRGRLVVPRKPA